MCARLSALAVGCGLEVNVCNDIVSECGMVQHTATVFTAALLQCKGWEDGRRWWKA